MSAVVLFSGGQDSTTCLYWAKQNFETVYAVGFNYGQKHLIELHQAQKIADIAEVPFTIFDIRGTLKGSALTEHDKNVADAHELNPDLPAAFVPARNAVFLTLAAGFAYQHQTQNLVGGMCETDFSGYPDCRREFVDSMEKSLSLALDFKLQIHTPLMYMDKAETWKMAKDLNCLDVIIEHSHTDYNGDRTQKNAWGFGKLDNPASVLRAKGYEEALAKGWV